LEHATDGDNPAEIENRQDDYEEDRQYDDDFDHGNTARGFAPVGFGRVSCMKFQGAYPTDITAEDSQYPARKEVVNRASLKL